MAATDAAIIGKAGNLRKSVRHEQFTTRPLTLSVLTLSHDAADGYLFSQGQTSSQGIF